MLQCMVMLATHWCAIVRDEIPGGRVCEPYIAVEPGAFTRSLTDAAEWTHQSEDVCLVYVRSATHVSPFRSSLCTVLPVISVRRRWPQ